MDSLKEAKKHFSGKKVLLIGLGILGGGVATTNWLLKQGVKLRITDLKKREELLPSIKKIKGKAEFILGGHKKEDVDWSEIVVVNPDVSMESEFVRYAILRKKEIWNEATIFFEFLGKPIVAITGTRGKTTTTWWTNHFLSAKFKTSLAGNSTDFQFLKILPLAPKLEAAVVELPSFHLEGFNKEIKPPKVAVITNVYRDHLNRHKTEENYARVKANIFRGQGADDFLVLNYDDEKTKFLLNLKPKAKIYFFSKKRLPKGKNGVFYENGFVIFRDREEEKKVFSIGNFVKEKGEHNLMNLLSSSLAAHLFGVLWKDISGRIKTLPEVSFRQEEIYNDGKLKIINDTTATSPEGGEVAIKRFGGEACVLITGGTDRDLDYKEWAKAVKENIKMENIVFLKGSATEKMIADLKIKKANVFEDLEKCFYKALKTARQYKKSVILFSPAAKSFELFKNEYDRGEKLNSIVKKELGRAK
ncbi:MAG: UDP-N-acetylmuramoyl-L-alanine--D-glutamate ligase [Candidatus Paceibacterota bacterium]